MENYDLFNDELARKAEHLGILPEEWLKEIYTKKWFKLFVPKELGGLALTFPQALEVEEKLAKLDGSLGWTITLCAGAGWFVGFMEQELRKEIFLAEDLCLAGSGFVGGKADLIDNEYHISGGWTYASGALHASHFTANCEIFENGKPLLQADGTAKVKAFILRKEEVKVLDGWNYMGMIATGSHAFEVNDLRVPVNRSFEIAPDKTQLADPIYKFPFLQFAEATLAVNILGISLHLKELISVSFWKRNDYRKYDSVQLEYFDKLFSKQTKKLTKARVAFYKQVELAWNELNEFGELSEKRQVKISKSSRKLTQHCREVNAKLYPFAGLEAAKTHTELNRVWRDFNTVSQHALLTFPYLKK